MDIGSVLMFFGMSYGLGRFWYDVLPVKGHRYFLRVAAYPFLGMIVAATYLPFMFTWGGTFGGVSLMAALVGSFFGVVVDWAIATLRPATAEAVPEDITIRRAA